VRLLFLFGAGILFSLVSGWAMAFQRIARGMPVLPPVPPGAWRSLRPGALIAALLMGLAMPALAVSAVPVLLAEAWLALRKAR